MKKIFTISFLLLYSLLVIDASFSVHKCMGELKSFAIGTVEKKCCCGDQMNDGCCGNESITFEDGSKDELFSSFSFLFENGYFTTLYLSYNSVLTEYSDKSLLYVFADLPPPNGVDLYLKNCSIIYYG